MEGRFRTQENIIMGDVIRMAGTISQQILHQWPLSWCFLPAASSKQYMPALLPAAWLPPANTKNFGITVIPTRARSHELVRFSDLEGRGFLLTNRQTHTTLSRGKQGTALSPHPDKLLWHCCCQGLHRRLPQPPQTLNTEFIRHYCQRGGPPSTNSTSPSDLS